LVRYLSYAGGQRIRTSQCPLAPYPASPEESGGAGISA
jgi:hypothetical protein